MMKRWVLSLFITLAISSNAMATEAKIIGQWLLTTVEAGGKVQEVNQVVNFKEDGYAEMQGRVFGSWEYDTKKNTVTIESEMVKEFAGNWKIIKNANDVLVLKSNKSKLNLITYDEKKIEQNNKKSGLTGVWKLNGKNAENADVYISFKLPNKLKVFFLGEEMSGSSSGMWIYNTKDKTILMIVRDPLLDGKSKIVKVSEKGFELDKEGKKITALKLEQNGKEREKISTESEGAETADNEQRLDREKFSWYNQKGVVSYLKGVKSLKYIKSELINDLDAFATEMVSAKVSFDGNDNSLNIDAIFDGISARSYDEENIYYPLQDFDFSYNLIGEKVVTVPAGTFNCTVVDFSGSFGIMVRGYMINNRPGVYAKVIVEDDDKYTMYELAGIESDFKTQDNKEIIGKWLIVKVKSGGKVVAQSTNIEFINDGRISINNTVTGEYRSWDYNKEKNVVVLELDGKVGEFNIVKLTDSEMELQSDEFTYWFSKVKAVATSDKNPQFIGNWMLTNSADEYKTIQIKENGEIFEVESIRQAPIEENYPELKGKWSYNAAKSSVIFNTDKDESLCFGEYNIKKLDNDALVLKRDNSQLVFLKIDPQVMTQNNKVSGIEGVWKIAGMWDKKTRYFEFKSPYICNFGYAKDELTAVALWYYNPEKKYLFIAYAMHQLGGQVFIDKITKDEISFQNGLKAVRIK